MSKRHLSQQQTRRIHGQHARRIARVREAPELDESHLGPPAHGLVIAHYGSQLEVLGTDGDTTDQVWRCHLRSNLEALVTGDRVVWQADATNRIGVVTALLPRSSVLTRPDPYQKIKPVAANIDLILIVIAPLPTPSASLLDRYLVACAAVDIPALIVLNKSDLLDDANRDDLLGMLAEYQRLGYPHLIVSCLGDLSALSSPIAGKTVVLVGQSGVGKSSLVNALLPEARQRVNLISDNSGLGQHTTTTARLFPLDGGGALIDSPGIREFGVWHLSEEQIRAGFVDLQPYYGQCRFRNCQHRSEPGCALKLAADQGLILPRRLDSLHKLLSESQAT